MKRVIVMDGQGGGIGSVIVRQIKQHFGETVEIIALGTNAIATAQMLKAGANRGASGENAIVRTTMTGDILVGPIGVTLPHAMMGEVTLKMAEAVASCNAKKILLPITQENVEIVGITSLPLPHQIEALIKEHISKYI
jgi:hypothetical protein